ncbi:MAG: MerR family transcriptional regulator [Anaerolineaceae bacterium]|nr:MerR family transcriptional regulator [Anaerolineaceae bacterium]
MYTNKIAKAVGCHPNTVRLYEQWGLIPPAKRSANGYRIYTQEHLDQMRLARTALNTPWPGKAIRRSGTAIVLQAAGGDLGGSLESAYGHLTLIQSEKIQAESVAELVARWVQGLPVEKTNRLFRIQDAAGYLQVSVDQLRNWERNGLLTVPRDPMNRYRLYGSEELSRARVIRMLRNAGYSIMAILRMMIKINQDDSTDIKQALDTPGPQEDLPFAADRWLTTLNEMEERAKAMIKNLEDRINPDKTG